MPNARAIFFTGLLALLAWGCAEKVADPAAPELHFADTLDLTPIENPTATGARLPHLSNSGGEIIMSWVESRDDTNPASHQLLYSQFKTRQWSSPRVAASGDNWFINWADFPSVYRVHDALLAAHWLQRSSGGTYAYNVHTSTSIDGINWSAPYTPHVDGTATEHGFASFFSSQQRPALVWLDGRHTRADGADSTANGHASHDEQGGGPMTLRTRTLNAETATLPSIVLDERVCDCCQTAAVNAGNEVVIFYRDRSADEIRDIAYVYGSGNSWSQPALVYPDGWHIAGCPVNGPQADAIGEHIAVAWFSAADNTATVKIAFTADIASGFAPPLIVSAAAPLGRVDIVLLDATGGLITWLEQRAGGKAEVLVSAFDQQGLYGATKAIAIINAARASGFLQLARIAADTALLAYTDIDDQRIKTVSIRAAGGRAH